MYPCSVLFLDNFWQLVVMLCLRIGQKKQCNDGCVFQEVGEESVSLSDVVNCVCKSCFSVTCYLPYLLWF